MDKPDIDPNDYKKYKEFYENEERKKTKRKRLYYLKKYGHISGDKTGTYIIKPDGTKLYID